MIKSVFKAVIVLLCITVLALVGVFAWVEKQLATPIAHTDTTQTFIFTMPQGKSVRHVPTLLANEGALTQDKIEWVELALRAKLRLDPALAHIHAGEYDLSTAKDVAHVLSILHEGDVVKHSFTIVEGTRFRDLRALLASKSNLKQTIKELSDAEIMAALGKKDEHPEGWFAPDTFFYTSSDSDMDILRRALRAQEQRLVESWEGKQDGLPYQSAYELLIMASIIERETGVPKERPDIAGVFVRRLQKGMRLQTDPTVIYGMGDAYVGRITRADLRTPTPYNTYTINGLPPTPIAMPSYEAIKAAAQPAQGSALYFVAKGDGSHYFSDTLAEHQQAVRRYQLNRRADYRSSPAEASQ